MRRQRPANRKVANRKIAKRNAGEIGLAAVAAALELPIDGFEPELAALIERGAAAIAPASSRLAA
jgi:hypothetical protein